ncbi:MAG: hypothetical protein ABI671_14535 [Burkholderiales bacterium]
MNKVGDPLIQVDPKRVVQTIVTQGGLLSGILSGIRSVEVFGA